MEKSPFNQISNPDEIIFAPKEQKIQTSICDKNAITDISEDFNLPEYLPEIRRLLRVTPTIPMPARYIGTDIAEFSGNVIWNVLYVGTEGGLVQTKLSSAFEESVSFDPELTTLPNSSYCAYDEITPDGIFGKVLGPRKLNIRGKLSHRICVLGDCGCQSELVGEFSENSVKRLNKTLPSSYTVCGVDDTLELEERFTLTDGQKIAGESYGIQINEITPDESGAECRGQLTLKLLLAKDSSLPETVERIVPFSASAEMPLDGDGYSFRAHGKMSDISFDEEGENTTVCRVRLCVVCEAQKNIPTELCRDIFSTECECAQTMQSKVLMSSLICSNTSFVHDASSAIDGLFEGAQLVDVICTPQAHALTLENGHYILSGVCRYNLLFGANGEYTARESEFPFSVNVGDGDEEVAKYFTELSVLSCKARTEGENMAFSANICASVRACGEYAEEYVANAEFTYRDNTDTAAFKIAYPSGGESLWKIAKRYYVDPTELAEANGIKSSLSHDSPESLNGVKYLII